MLNGRPVRDFPVEITTMAQYKAWYQGEYNKYTDPQDLEYARSFGLTWDDEESRPGQSEDSCNREKTATLAVQEASLRSVQKSGIQLSRRNRTGKGYHSHRRAKPSPSQAKRLARILSNKILLLASYQARLQKTLYRLKRISREANHA
ncbi:hypothetical protein CVT26_009709 [Gymnopilus dilepis]|uniref:Uncharacterized protein n=1 Tax=Gymnopilus dilepis TaxID=231916 RepID=A0A409WCQ0_9AGAR|nr:hypothetical protein CVT26_009709 [Gymnopilus dilepis]